MLRVNLDNKVFRSVGNSSNGEVSGDTTFRYRQQDNVIWAEYGGGAIVKGFLVGVVLDQAFEFTYQHVNHAGDIMTGKCKSTPEILTDGRIRLREEWQWTCGDRSRGTSALEEVEK